MGEKDEAEPISAVIQQCLGREAMEVVADASEPNPQLVWDTMNAYQRTAALRAAIDLDLFTTIREGVNVATDLAESN